MVLCLIVGCGYKTGKIRPTTEKENFFRVSRVVVNQGEYMEELTGERRRRWISAFRYFASGKPAKDWDRFNVDLFPTLCLGHSKQQMKDPELAEVRSRRTAERRKRRFELLEIEIKEKMLKIDEPGKIIVEIPFSEEDRLGENPLPEPIEGLWAVYFYIGRRGSYVFLSNNNKVY